MRSKKTPATSGTPVDKPYVIEIIEDNGSGGKAIVEKLNSLSDPKREAYVKELENRWKTEFPKYPVTWVQLFAEILPKYVKKRFAGNLDLLEKEMKGATIQHQGQQIAKLVKESELYKFNQKYRNDIDVTDNGIVLMFQEWLKIQQDYLNEMGNTPDTPAKDQEPTYNNLLEAFKDVSEYKRVMAILQSKGYITADYVWQDHKKGWMTVVVSIIKLFAVKGYCKKTKFDPAEIQAICINTFQTEKISKSTIKHASPNNITINFK
jgi:hypothetical protein